MSVERTYEDALLVKIAQLILEREQLTINVEGLRVNLEEQSKEILHLREQRARVIETQNEKLESDE